MPLKSQFSPRPPYRVAVTGAGIITSLGLGWQANAEGFRLGQPALRPITVFDASKQRVQTGGEVVFDRPMPPHHLGPRQLARLDRASRLLVYAGSEALAQCGWSMKEKQGVPICLGTSAGGMSMGESYFRSKSASPGERRGLATKALLYQPQLQARFLADAVEIDGPVTILSNACASGANAIGHAFQLVRSGRAIRVLAGGYDALAWMVFAGFDSLQALSTTTPRPFDATRDGLALGEGAGLVTLERYEDAVARGAVILGEIAGYGANTDLHHPTQPQPDGNAALASMTRACADARVQPADIDYINAHGTGTPLNDSAEARAIQRWAGDDAGRMRVSSTKGCIGHLLGAAGAVETVICLMALKEGFVPPNVPVESPDSLCTFDLVRRPQPARLNTVLTNSFGFGGANATLILKAA